MISMCCCWPSASAPTRTSGSTCTPSVADSSARRARAAASSRTRPGLDAQHQVLEHGERGDEAQVLVHHADAQLAAGLGESMRTSRPSTRMRAAVRLVEPGQDAHERGLAGAVLAQEAEHLAAHRREADAVVGDDAREGLGDAGQLDRGDGCPRGRRPRRGRDGLSHDAREPGSRRCCGRGARRLLAAMQRLDVGLGRGQRDRDASRRRCRPWPPRRPPRPRR